MKTLTRAPAVLGAMLCLGALAACDREPDGTTSATPDPSAQTIDVKPAPPSGSNTPGTTPATGNESNLSDGQKQSQMPLEGQNHSYSSVAPQQSQKPGNGDAPSEGDSAGPDAQQPGTQTRGPQ